MDNERLYFRQNVLVEPLFNQWYAWAYLTSPATAAMYVANLHLKVMQSFVNMPEVHVAAMRDPAMRGGPFINYGAGRVPEVRALLEKTEREQAHMVEFAQAVKALDAMLLKEATGFSLDGLYARVPDILKGYVELVYDLNNQPAARFIEGLLYRSRFYSTASQSVALSVVRGDDRPLFFSSPSLAADDRLELSVPFAAPALDDLARMRYEPRPLGEIKEALGVVNGGGRLFDTFCTRSAPPARPAFDGEGVRVRYMGHACVLIETRDVSVLVDPVISYEYAHDDERYTYADLPAHLDYVLITHNHQDHCLLEALMQLRHKTGHFVVPKSGGAGLADISIKLALQNLGFRNVVEIDEMESVGDERVTITGLPFLGEHADLNIRTKQAFAVRAAGQTVLCAADSNNIEPQLYKHIHEAIGDVDVLFLGMECDGAPLSWVYGPLLTKPLPRKMDQSRRYDGSNYTRALDLVERIRPRHVYVYAMGQEPWLTYLTSVQYTDASRPIVESNKLVTECRRRGIESERVYSRKELFLRAR